MTAKDRQCLLTFLKDRSGVSFYTAEVDGIAGALTHQAILRFQQEHGDLAITGEPDQATDLALRRAVAQGMPPKNPTAADGSWWEEIEFFTPEEAACKCGGRYCSGFPHAVQPLLMAIADRARRWSGHPILIISGLRCETWNRLQGGVENSQHKFGEALDVYFCGVDPDTALAWLQSQPDVRYAYRIAGCDNIHFDIQPTGR